MSIYYSSEADLWLLCSQLCRPYIVCQKKKEDWSQSEKWGEGRQRRPNLKLQGGIIKSLKCNMKCVPKTSLKCTVLVRGADATPHPGNGHLLGWGEREGASSWCLSARSSADCSSSPGSAAPFVLCRQEARFLPSTVPRPPSLFPGFSRLLPARLETQASQDLPWSPWAVLAPPSSFSAGLMGCLVFITETFLAHSFSIPDGGMRRATKDISEFPWMWMLDEPSLLISESFCSKKIFLYSYLKPLENLQTGNGDTSKSYCYMTKASCKTTHIICLTELKMNLYYLCK